MKNERREIFTKKKSDFSKGHYVTSKKNDAMKRMFYGVIRH